MKILRAIVQELIGMFVDDESLALFAVILIAAVAAAVKLLGVPALPASLFLLAGCLAILARSVHRAAR